MKYKVRATSKYQEENISDNQLSDEESKKTGEEVRVYPEEGREWITDKERADMLEEKGFVTIVEAIKEEKKKVKQEIEVVGEKLKKTTRKKTTTKK